MKRLEGKVAIITGAASGQGASEAKLFAKEGAKVVATDMNDSLLNEVVTAINADYPNAAIAVKHNVAEEQDWIEVVKIAKETFGKIDILINNAGITGQAGNDTVEHWRKVLDINALGNFLGMKHVIPFMKENGQGSIVNISSLAGILGIGGMGAYAASKGATRTLTKGAAKVLGPDHIRVNSVHPGYIETPMIADYTKDENVKNHIISQIPLNYMGQPEDVANMVLFLASDEARFVTGAEFIIDGGQSVG